MTTLLWHRALHLVHRVDRTWVYPHRFQMVAAMTLLLYLFHAQDNVYLRLLLPLGAVAGLVVARLRVMPAFWLLLSVLFIHAYLVNGLVVPMVVNHKYLFMYWALMLGLALLTANVWKTVQWNARLIIGLCFAFATLWKLIAPEFPDGTFFQFRLLTDPRFQGFSEIVLGLSTADASHNVALIDGLRQPGVSGEPSQLLTAPRVAAVAQFMAIWTIVLEGLIAITFLMRDGRVIRVIRNLAVLVFIVTTYPIATVPGFARLLATMAFASCHPRDSIMRLAFLASFICVPIFELPMIKVMRLIF